MAELQAPHALVGLDELDLEDDRFAIRSFLPHDRLDSSLDRHGIISPPWVWVRDDGGISLVDGFKRILWAKKAGLKRIPCAVFPSLYPYEQLLLLRVEAKRFGPSLNAAEKAQIIAKLNRTAVEPYLCRILLPALGIPPRAEIIDKWCRLSMAVKNLLQAVASEAMAERAALDLVDWSGDEQAVMLALLLELRCSASVQMEIIERVTEIALRWNENRLAVLHRPEFQAICRHSRENHRQKTRAVRELLTRWRFPRLQEREALLARDLASLGLPAGSRVCHPPAFEGDEWQLQVSFHRPEELRSLLEKLLARTDFVLLGRAMKPER